MHTLTAFKGKAINSHQVPVLSEVSVSAVTKAIMNQRLNLLAAGLIWGPKLRLKP